MEKKLESGGIGLKIPCHKVILVMKLTCFLMCCLLFNVQAAVKAQGQTVSLKLDQVSVAEAIRQLKEQTQLDFFFSNKQVDVDRKVSLDLQDIRLDEALKMLLGEGYAYEFLDDVVIIKPVEKIELAITVPQKKVTLKGTVHDEDGGLLPGVTVTIKGTSLGTATDVNGKWALDLPDMDNIVLVFSFVGMKTQEVAYKGQQEMNVVLKTDAQEMDEVVVTGIVERKAESFTGAYVAMSNEDLKRVGNQNVFQSLKSLDPSLMIFDNMQWGSDPNKNPEMTLRGASSLDLSTDDIDLKGTYANDPNAPLFILDGFEASVQKIMDLDMDRVESLTILKDASAKAIYGSRAANGVIVIETKHSTTGDLRVTYTGNISIEAPDLSSYNLTNAAQKLELEKDFGLYDANWYLDDISLKKKYFQKYKSVVAGVDTDWLAKPLRNAVGTKHSLAVELGGKNLQVMANFSYNNIAGVMKGSSRDTYDGSIQVSYRHKKFNFRNSLDVVSNIAKDSPYGSFSEYALMNPYYSPYDENGLLVENAALSVDGLDEDGEFVANPLYNASLNTKINT